jgi:kynurenine formamidase
MSGRRLFEYVSVSLAVLAFQAGGQPRDRFDELFTGRAKIVDLTYTLNERTPHWPSPSYKPFHLETIATLEKDGVLSKAFYTPEHLGTHMDAPNHFEEGQPSVEQLPVSQLFGPAVVVDVRKKVEADPDYRLTADDLKAWEAKHGRIPKGAVVFMLTGWGKYWNDHDRYKNQDKDGVMHFPSFSKEAAEFLVKERDIHGVGIDNLSIDYGMSKDFVVHHIINGAGKYGLENVANLDKLPESGAMLIVAPPKIESGTGGPTRIYAVLP